MMIGQEIFGGTLVLGALAACFGKLKLLLSRLVSVLIVTVTVEGEAAEAVQSLCWSTCRRSLFGSRAYDSQLLYVRPHRRHQFIGFEKVSHDPVMFWRGLRPILLGCSSRPNDPNITQAPGSEQHKLVVTFLRGTWNSDDLIRGALQRHNDRHKVGEQCRESRFAINRCAGAGRRSRDSNGTVAMLAAPKTGGISTGRESLRLLSWSHDEIGPEVSSEQSAFAALALPAAVLEAVEEIRRWKASEAWYRDRQIPWTRGSLWYGKPGTGKTATIRATAQDLDLPVYIFDLASLSNQELTEHWRNMQQNVPCMAVIEDIDAVFRGRENRLGEAGGGLTFDCLLNCMDGIESASGVYKVVTTNNLADLDPALGLPSRCGKMSTRPGRLDRAIEMPTLDEAGRRKIAARILSDCPHHAERLVREGHADTGAQFTERCASVALQELWAAPVLRIEPASVSAEAERRRDGETVGQRDEGVHAAS